MVSKLSENFLKVFWSAGMVVLAILSYHISANEVPYPSFILLSVVMTLLLLEVYRALLRIK